MVINGDSFHPKVAGLMFSVLCNLVLAVAIGAIGGSGMALPGVLGLPTALASLSLLLSRPMRTLVGLRGEPRVPGPSLG
jgi:hypothetical protein